MPRHTLARRLLFSFFSVPVGLLCLELLLAGVRLAQGVWIHARREVVDAGVGNRLLICAGDSVTFGFPVDAEESYPAVLASLRPDLRVVNLGRPGAKAAGVVDELSTRLPEWKGQPAAVFFLAGHNDCSQDLPRGEDRMGPARDTLRRLTTYRLLTQLVAHTRSLASLPPPPEDLTACHDQVQAGFARLADLSRRYGLEAWLLTYPSPANPPRATLAVNELVVRESEHYALPTFDLSACYREKGPPGAFQADGLHLDAAGYAAMAACVAPLVDRARFGVVGG